MQIIPKKKIRVHMEQSNICWTVRIRPSPTSWVQDEFPRYSPTIRLPNPWQVMLLLGTAQKRSRIASDACISPNYRLDGFLPQHRGHLGRGLMKVTDSPDTSTFWQALHGWSYLNPSWVGEYFPASQSTKRHLIPLAPTLSYGTLKPSS
jgi:hypothetical protein